MGDNDCPFTDTTSIGHGLVEPVVHLPIAIKQKIALRITNSSSGAIGPTFAIRQHFRWVGTKIQPRMVSKVPEIGLPGIASVFRAWAVRVEAIEKVVFIIVEAIVADFKAVNTNRRTERIHIQIASS